MNLARAIRQSGPAVIVAAVVLGPGSIVTSSRVGANYGLPSVLIVITAGILMFGMVSLASRLGVIYEQSPCTELRDRLGKPFAQVIGWIVFGIVALFQFSNNVAMIAGMEVLFDSETAGPLKRFDIRALILVVVNTTVIAAFYRSHNLYHQVEKAMKVLVLLLVLAFLGNFLVILLSLGDRPPRRPVLSEKPILPLLGLVGTTFSVAGAFYQAYMVKEKGWTLKEWQAGRSDAEIGAIALVGTTTLVLATSALVFHDRGPVSFQSAGDVAQQLEPLFGASARVIFAVGLLAGAVSSFLVNAMIGGTILADGLGRGSRLRDPWTRHLTALALGFGMVVALLSFLNEESTVALITVAQALTVLGLPALAFALLYLGSRPELDGERLTPKWMIITGWCGFAVALILALRTLVLLFQKLG